MQEIGTGTLSVISYGIDSVATVATAIATVGLVAFSFFQWRSTQASVKESTKLRYSQLILPVEKTMFSLTGCPRITLSTRCYTAYCSIALILDNI